VPEGTEDNSCYKVTPMNGSILVMIFTLSTICIGAILIGVVYYCNQGKTIYRAPVLDEVKAMA